MKTFKIMQTTSESITAAKQVAGDAFRASWVYFALSFFVAVLAGVLGAGSLTILSTLSFYAGLFIASICATSFACGVAVNIDPFTVILEGQFWRYCLSIFLVWIIPAIASSIVFLLGGVFSEMGGSFTPLSLAGEFVSLLAAVAVFIYIYARLSLLLPAVAIGENISVETAWLRSEGNVWKIVSTTSLVAVLIAVVINALWLVNLITTSQVVIVFLQVVTGALVFYNALIQGALGGRILSALR